MIKDEVKEELAKKAGQCNREEKDDTGEAASCRFPVRLLRAEEIECRIATINEKGLSLLLFKDARVDQRLLDEVCTPLWVEADTPDDRREPVLYSRNLG